MEAEIGKYSVHINDIINYMTQINWLIPSSFIMNFNTVTCISRTTKHM